MSLPLNHISQSFYSLTHTEHYFLDIGSDDDKANCRLAFKQALFLCWELNREDKNLMVVTDSLPNHFKGHHKQLSL